MDNEISIHELSQAMFHLELLILRCEKSGFTDQSEKKLYLEKSKAAIKKIEEFLQSKGVR
jgi:hypothetical protein